MHTLSVTVHQKLDDLERHISEHYAMKELSYFGELLASAPLNGYGLKTFFATMDPFFKNIPTGVLALALRISDDWMERDRYNATAMGAYVLFADVDEYGLQHMQSKGLQPTHHQLFLELTHRLGITKEDLKDQRYRLAAGCEFGNHTTEYYRTRSIGEALGFHLASETTSSREFIYFLKGFQAFKEVYGLKSNHDPVLEFFRVHTLVEPMHKAMGRSIIDIYYEENPEILEDVEKGVLAFMEGFGKLFQALNKEVVLHGHGKLVN